MLALAAPPPQQPSAPTLTLTSPPPTPKQKVQVYPMPEKQLKPTASNYPNDVLKGILTKRSREEKEEKKEEEEKERKEKKKTRLFTLPPSPPPLPASPLKKKAKRSPWAITMDKRLEKFGIPKEYQSLYTDKLLALGYQNNILFSNLQSESEEDTKNFINNKWGCEMEGHFKALKNFICVKN
jgi:hypothetical protein